MRAGAHPSPARASPFRRSVALVAAGGAVGAVLRVRLGLAFPAAGLPWATLGVNVCGAFLLASLLGALERRPRWNAWARPLLGTGVLGGFTTFSTLSVELHRLLMAGRLLVAVVYLSATLLLGLGAAAVGLRIAGRKP